MIDILFEQKVIQNTGLAAEVLWQAVHSAHEASGRTTGVPFPAAFLILPITFHRRTARSLSSKNQPGAMYKALSEDREIAVGLQERMQALAPLTFRALSVAFQCQLIQSDTDHFRTLLPRRKSLPIAHVDEEVKVLFKASKRVGQALAEMSLVQLGTQLNVRF